MKLPVAYSLGNRAASLDQDALLRNGIAEADEQQVIRARKRPAIESAFTVATGTGQGLFNWSIPNSEDAENPTQILVAITGDTLNTAPAGINKSLAFTVEPS